MQLLNERIEGDFVIREYTRDSVNVSAVVKLLTPKSIDFEEPIEPQPTLEQATQATLLETQYQTLLIEMLAGF